MTTDEERYKRAKETVDARRGFFTHLLIYVLVNAGLFLMNLLTTGEARTWWFYWPLIGWGIGVAAHGFSVFGFFGLFGRGWEEREIKRLMDKDREGENRP